MCRSFLYNITGLWSTAALPHICFSFFGSHLPRWAVFPGIWIGFGAGLAVWLSLAKRLEGAVNITALGAVDVNLYAFTTTIATGILLCTFGSLFTPLHFDWSSIWDDRYKNADDEEEVKIIENDERFSPKSLKKWLYVSAVASVVVFAVFMLIWPLSLYRDYIFTRSFFTGWVAVSITWAFLGFLTVGIYPLWEGRAVFLAAAHALRAVLTGRDDAGRSPAGTGGAANHAAGLASESGGSSVKGGSVAPQDPL